MLLDVVTVPIASELTPIPTNHPYHPHPNDSDSTPSQTNPTEHPLFRIPYQRLHFSANDGQCMYLKWISSLDTTVLH